MDLNCFFYPEVYLPDDIKGIFSSITGMPQKPIKPKPPKNVESGDAAILDRIFGVAYLLTIVITAILIVIDVHTKQYFITAYLVMAFLFFVCTAYFFSIIKMRMENKKYKRDLIEYQKDLERYDEEVAKLKSDSDLLASFRKDALAKAIKAACNREGVVLKDNEIDIKEGPGETFFHSYLLSLCSHGFEVYSKCKVAAGKSFFYPDFALIDEYNLCYDIEIDEPYSLGDKTPIHYLQYIEFISDYQSIDFGRNIFFTEKGWVVIRFSERQIYEDPLACVNYILDVQKEIENKTNSSRAVFPDALIDHKWTEEESRDFAMRHYRDTYIRNTDVKDDKKSNYPDLKEKEKQKNTSKGNLSTEATYDEMINGFLDEFGLIYSNDGKKLLTAQCNATNLVIKNGVEVICDRAFQGNEKLQTITFSNGITSVGEMAFADCLSLKSLTIPDSVIKIGKGAFVNCTSLRSISISKSLTNIENITFWGCKSLLSISISNSVTQIGNGAFVDCASLETIVLPNSVKTIGDIAFSSCLSLKSVNIPNSVTNINSRAFRYCKSLDCIIIPKGSREKFEKLLPDNKDILVEQ